MMFENNNFLLKVWLCVSSLLLRQNFNVCYTVEGNSDSVIKRHVKKPSGNKPVIHTFISIDDDNQIPIAAISVKDELLKIWVESWREAGWDPVILTNKDARKHRDYKHIIVQLSAAKVDKKRWGRYLRYIAMAVQGGGFYSDISILPLRSSKSTSEGSSLGQLPNKGKFTIHESQMIPELMSGNKIEWETMAIVMTDKPSNNDNALLKKLVLDSPNLFLVEDSVISSIHILKSTDTEICKMISSKNMATAKYQYRIARMAGISRGKMYEAVKSSLSSVASKCGYKKQSISASNKKRLVIPSKTQISSGNEKPAMHTFFEPAYNKYDNLLLELEEWKTAWKNAGWTPVVLTLKDAVRHPYYIKFKKAFDEAKYAISDYDRMCFYRWLAMAATGGGWMSDYDTFPLYSNPSESLTLPNSGKFTSFQNHVPALVVGSTSEWERMSKLMYTLYLQHGREEFYSDMLGLRDIQKKTQTCVFNIEVVGPHEVYRDELASSNMIASPLSLQKICHKMEGKRAIHFSHAACSTVHFCDGVREAVVGKWIKAWNEQCVITP